MGSHGVQGLGWLVSQNDKMGLLIPGARSNRALGLFIAFLTHASFFRLILKSSTQPQLKIPGGHDPLILGKI